AYEPNENHPPYPPEVIAAIRNSVEQNAECLQLLDEAAQFDHCLFPRVYDGLATRIEYLSEMRDAARFLSERNILLAHSGQMDALFDSTASCLALSRRIPDYPCLIECLVSSLIQLIAVESLENSFNMVHFSEEQFSVLQGEFQQLIQSNTLTPAIIAESTWFIEVTGLSPQEYLKIHGGWHGGKPWEKGGFFLYHLSGFNYKDAVLMSELFEQWVEISLLPLEQQPGELEKLDKLVDASASGLNGYGILMYMPATKRASEINLRVKGQLQIAETALAIERYRLKHDSLPDTLEALVPEFIDTVYLDPFDGKPIRYVKYEDGYMLYTIGEDGIDNGGLNRSQMSKKLGVKRSKEYDHPFTVRREK
ncbi:MAG: hypothetical protein ACYTER_06825, partial [Planctomycetota bacterium]